MSVQFERPVGIISKQGKFSGREVGINHPDVPGYIKIADNGDIYIMANGEVGIIISPSKGTIFLVGKTVKLLTNDIRWNENSFNPHATTYSEATLIQGGVQGRLFDDMNDILGES